MNNAAQNLVIKKNSERAALWMPYDPKFAYYMINELKAHYNDEAKAWVFKPMQIEEVKALIRKWKDGKLEEPAPSEPSKQEEPDFEPTDEASPWEKAEEPEKKPVQAAESSVPNVSQEPEKPEEPKAVQTIPEPKPESEKKPDPKTEPKPVEAKDEKPASETKPVPTPVTVKQAEEGLKNDDSFFCVTGQNYAEVGRFMIGFYFNRLTSILPDLEKQIGQDKAIALYESRSEVYEHLKKALGTDKMNEAVGSAIIEAVKKGAKNPTMVGVDDGNMFQIVDSVFASYDDLVVGTYNKAEKEEENRKKRFDNLLKNTSKIKAKKASLPAKTEEAKAKAEKAKAAADKSEAAYKAKEAEKKAKKDAPKPEPVAAEKEDGSEDPEESQISLI